jgi:hypothetical protein
MSKLKSSKRRRRRVRISASTLGVVVVFVSTLGAHAADANSYDVYACSAGQGSYLNPSGSAASWTLVDHDANYYPYDQCPAPNGFGIISVGGYIAPQGDYGQVSFTAPGSLRIGEVQMWRSLFDYGLGSGGTSQRNYAENEAEGLPTDGDEFEGTSDIPHGAVGSEATTNHGIVASNYLSVNLAAALPHTFAYVIGCGFEKGCTTGGHDPASPNGPDTILRIYGAIVTVEDNTPPTLSLGNTGLLDGGTQSGSVPLTINASAIAGIEKLQVYAGSNSTPSFTQDFTQTSNCQFWEAVPCQNLSNYQYLLDTTDLPNGTYYITVKAYDPAGNVVAVSSPSPVTVQNATGAAPSSTSIGPGSPLSERGPANGANASDEAKLSARWVDARGAKILETTLTGRYGTHERLTGRLATATGQPISGAMLDVSETPAYAGAKTVRFADVRTGPTGAWTLTLPKGISSSTLRIAYRSHVDDTIPVATATLTLRVHAGILLRIAPHVTSVGHTIYFSGTLRGTPISPGGKQLVLEASSGGEWIEFRTITTDAKGRYRASYRFKFPGPITYRFRAASLYEADFPFLASSSNVVTVHER